MASILAILVINCRDKSRNRPPGRVRLVRAERILMKRQTSLFSSKTLREEFEDLNNRDRAKNVICKPKSHGQKPANFKLNRLAARLFKFNYMTSDDFAKKLEHGSFYFYDVFFLLATGQFCLTIRQGSFLDTRIMGRITSMPAGSEVTPSALGSLQPRDRSEIPAETFGA